MLKTRQHILKANEVTFDDPLLLDFDAPSEPAEAPPPCASAPPRVRIAQNHSEYAVIEVTCACGKTTWVRCDYAPGSR